MTRALMRIELLLACPPTRKCRALLALANEAAARFPGQIRIDEYEAGTACPVTPTDAYRRARSGTGKFKKIPSVFVNGVEVAIGEAAVPETFHRLVEEQLRQPRAT